MNVHKGDLLAGAWVGKKENYMALVLVCVR